MPKSVNLVTEGLYQIQASRDKVKGERVVIAGWHPVMNPDVKLNGAPSVCQDRFLQNTTRP